ncbi:hypothetical protein [Azonexus hydrophilus]|uniref:hypothetical protein n=1 Tax=Azonexus hydrophilus TaxID=418702 RepID=UPI00048EBD02|nr:hypothetical protein [Azonexus hydrophilus]
MGTAYLLCTVVTIILAVTITTYYYWRQKQMDTSKEFYLNYYKGCVELYREAHKQDLNENAVDDYEQSLKDMFDSFKKK